MTKIVCNSNEIKRNVRMNENVPCVENTEYSKKGVPMDWNEVDKIRVPKWQFVLLINWN